MTPFLLWLREQLDQITDVEGPVSPVAEGETAVGTIEDLDTKRLYVLRGRLLEESRQHMEKTLEQGLADMLKIFEGHGGLGEDLEESAAQCTGNCQHCVAMREGELLEARVKLVGDLLWANVKHGLSEEGAIGLERVGNAVGIREGWTVVGFDQQPRVIHVLVGGRQPFPFGAPGGE